jgi:ubiquinone/menaquinone biosynthesis C-methylase UbiE
MSQTTPTPTNKKSGATNHAFFARTYELLSRGGSESRFMRPLREETAGRARGLVLEIGAGNGLNFSFYDPAKVERVEAIEPDTTMLLYARRRLETARVPINLLQATAENLPFGDQTFDSVVTTLVFCSVGDPARGLREILRVLKPGGTLFMAEHIRSQKTMAARMQDILTPLTRLTSGNCHWNRDTVRTVTEAGFHVNYKRDLDGLLLPMIILQAIR